MGKPMHEAEDGTNVDNGLKMPPPARLGLSQLSRMVSKDLDVEERTTLSDEDDDDLAEENAARQYKLQLEDDDSPLVPPIKLRSVGSFTSEGYTGHANEDRLVIQSSARFHLLAVIDGHGGHKAADYLVSTLFRTLEMVHEKCGGRGFTRNAIVDAVEALDQSFLATASRQQDDSGACFLAVILYWDHASECHQKLVLNCGDCRAVVRETPERLGGHRRRSVDSRDDRHSASVHALSEDHCFSNRAERLRVLEAGAFLRNRRIAGVLEPFRSIGDLDMKGKSMHGWVIPTPEIRESELLVNRTTLVVATDGVWAVLSTQRVGLLAHQELTDGGDAQSAAEMIADEARELGSTDDITVIVVSV